VSAARRRTGRDGQLEQVQSALGTVARRAKDFQLHEALGARVGYTLEGPYYGTLARLGLAGRCTVSELADGLGLELSTVSRRVKALEQRGLVERHIDADDRRVSHLSLTAEGRELFDALSASWRELLAEVLAGWDQADLDTFTELFARFAGDLETYAEEHR
jgi:DNA-binding MarR family transcriptional regulator